VRGRMVEVLCRFSFLVFCSGSGGGGKLAFLAPSLSGKNVGVGRVSDLVSEPASSPWCAQNGFLP